MGRRLVATVILPDPEGGHPRVFSPGDDVPEWAADRITNPAAWASDDPESTQPVGSERPPMSGKGSGRNAWAAYAETIGVAVDADMTREDIAAAVEEAEQDS